MDMAWRPLSGLRLADVIVLPLLHYGGPVMLHPRPATCPHHGGSAMRHGFSLLVLSCFAFCPTLPAREVQEAAPKQAGAKLDQYGDPLPEGAIARLGSPRFYHEGGLVAAAFSPDGEVIVGAGIGDKGGLSLRFWETASGREHSRITLEDFILNGLAFGPDGKSVFVGEELGVAQYDWKSGKLLRRIAGPVGHAGLYQFALTSDGKTIAAIYG